VQVYSADWVLPVDAPPIRDGAVAIENGRIAAVGAAGELGTGTRFEEAAIIPGFVNTHSHLEYSVYAGFGDGLADFPAWISLHVERKRRIGWDDFVAIAELGAAECLSSGITTVGDCSYSGAAALACDRLGLRAIVYLEVFGADPDDVLERHVRLRTRAEAAFGERVKPGVAPHAPYTISPQAYEACASLGLPMATHLSESPSELDYLLRGEGAWAGYSDLLVEPPGTTGPRLLADLGLLGRGVVAAHCTYVDAEEIELLSRSGTGVAHCPRSNAWLGCGVAPLADLRASGVGVGIGTDSPASTPSFDFFDELRAAVLVSRGRERRPDALSATEALELGTLGGARALVMEEQVGSLSVGKRADLAVVSLAGSAYVPWEDPAAAIVFGGSPARVALTMVGGEVRYEKGGVEWHDLRRRAANARSRMLAGSSDAPAVAPA
jgi:cytosine/adenosine deaminase-related metal-dependent hydrolase